MYSLKKRSEQGFTIVELLIVIVVIGILAALVITTYNGIQQKGRNTERQTDLKALQGQLEAYYAEEGRYPTEANFGGASNTTWIDTNMKGLDPEALRDPKAADNAFGLATTSTPNQYSYAASLEGGGACDNAATGDCAEYVLTAQQEGDDPDIIMNSLN